MNRGIFVLAAACALFAACSKPPAETASVGGMDTADPAARGAELLAPFKAELREALMAGMKDGPATAIKVCSGQAPGIAASLSVDGVRMGRSSHKLRNPANAPPSWLEPIIERWAASEIRADEETRLDNAVLELEDGRHGYAEPIFMQPVCLTCHGSGLADGIAEQIAALYPEDQATGFSAGGFRGVFWVEF